MDCTEQCWHDTPQQLDVTNYNDAYRPNGVTNLTGYSPGPGQVQLSWNPSNVHAEAHFSVWRWCGSSWCAHVGNAFKDSGGILLSNQPSGTQKYGVWGYTYALNSPYGDYPSPPDVTVYVQGSAPPSPPSVSISGSNGNGSVSWGHVSGATYYNVFVERWNSGSKVTVLNWVYDTASPRTFSYSVSDYYHAAVKACNGSGCSSQTNSSPYWVWLETGPLLLLEDYFSSGSINTSLWGTAVGGGATIVQSGGYLQISVPNAANAYADVYSKSYFPVGTTFEARVWVGSGQSYDHKGIGYANARVGPDCGSGETQAAMWRGQDRDKYTETKRSSSSYNCTKRQSNYPSGWRTIKVERVSSSQVKFYENESLIGTHSSYIPTGSLRIRFSAYTYTLAPSDYVTIWVDWVKVTQP